MTGVYQPWVPITAFEAEVGVAARPQAACANASASAIFPAAAFATSAGAPIGVPVH